MVVPCRGRGRESGAGSGKVGGHGGGDLLIYFIGIDGVKGRFKILVDEFMCLRVDAGMEVGIQ